jgi:hypothetical protein
LNFSRLRGREEVEVYLGALGPRVDGAWYCICLSLPEMTFSRLGVGEEVEAYLGASGPRGEGAWYCICLSMLYACLSIKFRNTSMYICIFCGSYFACNSLSL